MHIKQMWKVYLILWTHQCRCISNSCWFHCST